MWKLEALWRTFRRYPTEWRLVHDDMTMECQVIDVPDGAEIKYVFRGQPYHSFVHATRAEAQDEARRKRAELIERGWSEYVRETEFARI